MSEQKEQGSALNAVSPLNIPDKVYNRVFQQDGDGAAILQELSALFYDQVGFQPGISKPDDAVYAEGQRSVIRYLMSRSAQ